MTEKKMDRKNYFLKKIMNTITHKISKIFYRMCAIFLGSMIVSILWIVSTLCFTRGEGQLSVVMFLFPTPFMLGWLSRKICVAYGN